MVSDDVSCEVYTDYLVVAGKNLNLLATADNGDYYDDSDKRQMAENMPPSISASEKITWRVEKSYGKSSSGWKICFGSDKPKAVDCLGVTGGTAVEDVCGICDGDGTSCLDCMGVPNGNAVLDQCDVCNGDGSSCKQSEEYQFKSIVERFEDGFKEM